MNKRTKNERYQQKMIGLGSPAYRLGVYIGNQPDYPSVDNLQSLRPAVAGEVADIIAQTGNHWRKVFSLCAKISFLLWPSEKTRWQDHRDDELFQTDGTMALLFSPPDTSKLGELQLVLGKQYCERCFPNQPFLQAAEGFPLNHEGNVIQTPYFDYRQLSNQRLEVLVKVIKARLEV